MTRPVRPPQGVDPYAWDAHADAAARAHLSFMDAVRRVEAERQEEELREQRRRTRRAWGALVLLALLAVAMTAAPGLTTAALTVLLWLKLGKPGLPAIRKKFIEHRQ